MVMKRITGILFCIMLTAPLWADTLDKEMFQDAEKRFRNKDYELALVRYDTLIRKYPLSQHMPDAQFRKALTLYRLGKLDESLNLFKRVETRYRSTQYLTFVPFWIGIVEYDKGDFESAVTDLGRFLALNVESDLVKQALLYKGMGEIALSRHTAAKATLLRLAEVSPNPADRPSATVLLMSLHMRDGAYADVVSLYESLDAAALDPKLRDQMTLYAAEALYAQGRFAEAKSLFEKNLTASPDIVTTVYQRLFMIAQHTGDIEESRRIVTRAESILSGKPDVLKEFWIRVGIQSYNQGKKDLAEYYFQRVWDLRSRETISSTTPIYLAEIKTGAGEQLRAMSILEEYLSTGKDSFELILLKLGEICIQTENWVKADEYLSRFLKDFPGSQYYAQGAYLKAYALYKNNSWNESSAVIQNVFSQGKTGTYSGQLLKLKASVLQNLGKRQDAIQTLSEYLIIDKTDISSRVDLLKLLFAENKYPRVLEEAEKLWKDFPALEKTRPGDFLVVRYLTGLSYVSMKRYADAQKALSVTTVTALEANGLRSLIPYNAFYRGWVMYRLADYKNAIPEFALLLSKYPAPELSARAAYLAGWCAYSLSQYEAAEQYLGRLSSLEAAPELREKGLYLLGKSQAGRKKNQEAAITFQNIYIKSPKSPFADDALFEHAGILLILGKTDEALRSYYDVYKKYPDSPLKLEAMFKRGEVLFNVNRFKDARDAFYEYRSLFPKSDQFDAALYWGGLSSMKLGEPFGASMLWEQIINEYRNSPFRPDAIQKTAEIYAASGEFRKALTLYTEMIAVYQKEARSIDAEKRAEELRYLLLGLSDREAELSVIIGREGGAKTEKGRKAILDLCRIYIYESTSKQDLAVQMLSEVSLRKDADASSAAHARFLTAEYYYRKGDLIQAATIFLEAATMNPQDKDLMAMSIYRSAEMMKFAGRPDDTAKLVKRLEDNFPSSQWAAEGKKLVGDKR